MSEGGKPNFRQVPSVIGDGPGRVPPQAIDIEEAVIGAMLLEGSAINEAIEILKPDSFYKRAHQIIFEMIQNLFQNSEPVDILSVTQMLRKKGMLEQVGGPFFLANLTNKVTSAANIEYHARIIAQKHIQRELIRISSDIIKMAYDETTDVLDLLDKAEQGLFQVAEGNLGKSYEKMSDVVKRSIEGIQKAKENKDGISGVPTGFHDLDKLTAGFHPADMIVIAARPAMGKTAFVLSMARNTAVDYGKGVALFSLEMDAVQLVNRLISSEAEIESDKLKKGTLEPYEYEKLYNRITALNEAPIFIDDTPALSVFEFRAKCRRLKAQHDIQMVIIDYLQLMTAGSDTKGNRELEISTISRSIKSVAKELGIPIIALSQLSRKVEERGGDKKPQLSDLRESGAIEQDADMVMFLYRPEYYGIEFYEDNTPTKGLGEVIVAKHRSGGLEDIKLRFIGQFTKFTNLDGLGDDPFAQVNSMAPNSSFDEDTQTLTLGSKMNDDDPFGSGNNIDDVPF